ASGGPEHQRGAGPWQAEWRPLRDLFETVGSAASWLRESLAHLEVDAVRMRANLDRSGGLLLAERVTGALAPALGRLPAHDLVTAAAAEAVGSGRPFADVLAGGPGGPACPSARENGRPPGPAGRFRRPGGFIDPAPAAHAAGRSAPGGGAP